jgi:hypothetical protein
MPAHQQLSGKGKNVQDTSPFIHSLGAFLPPSLYCQRNNNNQTKQNEQRVTNVPTYDSQGFQNII